jgi:cytoskeletal protein CcmA (bactofilin family)
LFSLAIVLGTLVEKKGYYSVFSPFFAYFAAKMQFCSKACVFRQNHHSLHSKIHTTMSVFGSKKEVPTHQVETNNIIGKGTKIIGDIITHGNIRIDGELNGNISSKSKVALGETAIINGNLHANNAEIEGEINGNLYITEQLTLKAKAVVNGDIFALRMVMETGSKINGQCKVGEAPQGNESNPTSSNQNSKKKPEIITA